MSGIFSCVRPHRVADRDEAADWEAAEAAAAHRGAHRSNLKAPDHLQRRHHHHHQQAVVSGANGAARKSTTRLLSGSDALAYAFKHSPGPGSLSRL